jgi:hypothetical protein
VAFGFPILEADMSDYLLIVCAALIFFVYSALLSYGLVLESTSVAISLDIVVVYRCAAIVFAGFAAFLVWQAIWGIRKILRRRTTS